MNQPGVFLKSDLVEFLNNLSEVWNETQCPLCHEKDTWLSNEKHFQRVHIKYGVDTNINSKAGEDVLGCIKVINKDEAIVFNVV